MYLVVGIAVLTILGASLVGSFRPLKVFGRRRLVALGIGIATLVGGSALLDALDPDKGSEAAVARTAFAAVQSAPEDFLGLDARYTREWGRLKVSGTLKNRSDYLLTDVKLRCRSSAENGSGLDHASFRVRSLVPPAGSAEFGPLDVMRLDQQVKGAGCDIVDASIASADCTRYPTDARCQIDHLP